MPRKVFVSYKYNDSSVRSLPGMYASKVHDYVNYIETKVLNNHIYKGEHQDEDLSGRDEDYIWEHLKDKIWDSSVTVVLISPKMREPNKWEKSQWIPWEISYSIRETTRSDRTSHRNSIVGVVLPDQYGRTTWFNKSGAFPILKSNLENGYIYLTDWLSFCRNPQYTFDMADRYRINTPEYRIVKAVNC